MDLKQKIEILRCIDDTKYAFTHRNLPESENSKCTCTSLDSFKHHAIIESPATRHSAVSAYGDSHVSPAQPHINAYEIFLQHDWLLFLDIIGSQKQLATYNFHIK